MFVIVCVGRHSASVATAGVGGIAGGSLQARACQETIERFLPGRPSTSATNAGGALKEFREARGGFSDRRKA